MASIQDSIGAETKIENLNSVEMDLCFYRGFMLYRIIFVYTCENRHSFQLRINRHILIIEYSFHNVSILSKCLFVFAATEIFRLIKT